MMARLPYKETHNGNFDLYIFMNTHFFKCILSIELSVNIIDNGEMNILILVLYCFTGTLL